MKFEYNLEKSQANKVKHGIDFEEAQALWGDELRLNVPSKYVGAEDRFILIAQMDKALWAAAYTIRDGNTRIISVRRARDEEKDKYDNS